MWEAGALSSTLPAANRRPVTSAGGLSRDSVGMWGGREGDGGNGRGLRNDLLSPGSIGYGGSSMMLDDGNSLLTWGAQEYPSARRGPKSAPSGTYAISLRSSTADRLHLPPAKRTGNRLHRDDSRCDPWAPAIDLYVATNGDPDAPRTRRTKTCGGTGGARGSASAGGRETQRRYGGYQKQRQGQQGSTPRETPREGSGTLNNDTNSDGDAIARASTNGSDSAEGKARASEHLRSRAPRIPQVAKRLMKVRRPGSAERRLADASLALAAAAADDRFDYAEGVMYTSQRPATAAAVAPSGIASAPLTVLLDDADDAEAAKEAATAAEEAALKGGRRTRERGGARARGQGRERARGRGEGEGEGGQGPEDGEHDMLSLKVQLQPCVPINCLSFHRAPGADAPPRATLFEHVDGCRHCHGLYAHFTLPNGKQGHLFDRGPRTVEQAPASALLLPPRPTSLARLCQLGFPHIAALERLSIPRVTKNTGVFTPVPPPAPLPESHTLPVVDPSVRSKHMFGNIRADPPRVAVVPEIVVVEVNEVVTEAVNVGPPWKMEASVFAPRKQESDAKDFVDTEHVISRMFQKDWVRVVRQDRFFNYIRRESKKAALKLKLPDRDSDSDNVDAEITTEQVFKDLEALLVSTYRIVAAAFVYYASLGSGSVGGLQLNEYTEFLDNCKIPEPESRYIKRGDCDTLFITADYVEDRASDEAAHMESNALLRFEFLEVVIRISVAKYADAPDADDAAAAHGHGHGVVGCLRRLLEENLVPNLPPIAAELSDDFRTSRLYTREVDEAFVPHVPLLKMLYKRYLVRADSGRRPKLLKLEHWTRIMDDCQMINSDFTSRESKLCYLRAKMVIVDEIQDRVRNESLTFTEFLEALARVAEFNCYPSDKELGQMRYPNRLEYVKSAGPRGPSGAPHPTLRASRDFGFPKLRPLHVKIAQTLDVMFRRLDWDDDTRAEYNAEHLMRHLRDIDKAINRG